MERAGYPSDLTDAQWTVLEPLLRRGAGPGRPATVDLREVLNSGPEPLRRAAEQSIRQIQGM